MSRVPSSVLNSLSIACASGFWGDTPLAVGQLLRAPELDYIVFDYLSEVTMTILAKLKKRDPQAGFAADFLTDVIEPHLEEIARRKIRLVSNAGGMNPEALRNKIEAVAGARGLKLKIACVLGDDLLASQSATAASLPRKDLESANAYLGAPAIAEALAMGADIVLTGRVVDSALVLGPVAHELGISWTDYDALALGSLAGHIIECGAQCCGGNFTDWREITKKEDVGFPIVSFPRDGTPGFKDSFELTKAPGTGGSITPLTVAEQIVYEIGDPSAYQLPDVICDFSEVKLNQKGQDRVEISGARGRAPSGQYKVLATYRDGWKIAAQAYIGGMDALEKSRSVGETILARAKEVVREKGWGDYRETRVEALGGPMQALLRVSAAHEKAEALEVIAKEVAPAGTSLAPGLCSLLGGRAQPMPRVGLATFFYDKSKVAVSVSLDTKKNPITIASAAETPPLVRTGALTARKKDWGARISIPLHEVALARSGDKGNDANIGIIARKPEYYEPLKSLLTTEFIKRVFSEDFDSPGSPDSQEVLCWELPGFHGMNFLLKNCLGGGGAYSLRVDPQGKAFAQRLLAQEISFPQELL